MGAGMQRVIKQEEGATIVGGACGNNTYY